MYCPNCGKQNSTEHRFCRTCGLELEKILQSLAEQEPAKSNASLQRRHELFEKLGLFSLVSFTLLGLSFSFYKVVYYKMILIGANTLEAFALAFLFVFGLLTVFFFNYHKFFGGKGTHMRFGENDQELTAKETSKLLEEKFIESVSSVTENSTEFLAVENKTRKFR